jgi:hypothetical protein
VHRGESEQERMIVATMASLAGRERLLEQTLASLIPQVDAVCVYLNGHDRIPPFLRQPKVLHAVLSKEAGWRGAEAKLWWWDRDEFKATPYWNDDDVALIVDDDIIYPSNYVQEMTAALVRHPRSIACVHGSILTEPFESYLTSRWVARARGALARESRVHIPGTGTMAFLAGSFEVSLRRDVTWSHCVDVMAAIAAKAQGVEVWAVARPDHWLHPLALPVNGTGIFKQRTGAGNANVETERLQAAAPWPVLHAGAQGFEIRENKAVGRQRAHREPRTAVINKNAMLPPQAIAWLGERLRGATGAVVELGSGHGSALLAGVIPDTCRLFSIEHDAKFVGLVPQTTYVHAPIRSSWYDAAVIDAALPPASDIAALVIDGPPKAIGRAGVLAHLDRFGSGPVLIDDVHRPAERQLAAEIARRRGVPVVIHACDQRAFATIG